jgi:hypothetical protein
MLFGKKQSILLKNISKKNGNLKFRIVFQVYKSLLYTEAVSFI